MSIENNVNIIKMNIKNLQAPASIEIVIASKNQDFNRMLQAQRLLGQSAFGENIAQQLRDKYDKKYIWDYIGRLQNNKIKYLVGKTRYIQSIDSIEQCFEIEKLCLKANLKQKIFIEVNSGQEKGKGGVLPSEVIPFYYQILEKFSTIEIEGLMVVAPINDDTIKIKDIFLRSKELFDELNSLNKNIKYLSMGMSDDYIEAIKCGANMVRLGRAIFKETTDKPYIK